MFWPVLLDKLGNAAPVAPDWSVHAVDLGHSFSTHGALASQGLFGQLAAVRAPGGSATICLDVDGSEQIVRERHHHFDHVVSMPGIASRYR